MTLDEFLSRDGAPTAVEFGALCTPPISTGSISRIRRGEQNITRDVMLAIIAASGGLVTADGLLGLLPSEHADQSASEWPLPATGKPGKISGAEALA